MKMTRLVLAILFSVASVWRTAPALARLEDRLHNEELELVDARMSLELRTRASRLGTSSSQSDTTFVGYTPGMKSVWNVWSIWAGRGKDGFHRPTNAVLHKGMWDWEPSDPDPSGYINADSLQGWWPIAMTYTSTGGLLRSDTNRPWWAIDIGNQANYRGNQANGRTYGVIGVWHVDGGSTVPPTNAGAGTMAPGWAPLEGSSSAWMGLRAHGDLAYTDPITGNPFNEDLLMFGTPGSTDPDGSDHGFPGYGSQMDQMLYRDILLAGQGDPDLTISFQYRTQLSTGIVTTASTRTGWFDGDPLGVTQGGSLPVSQRNNFISSTDAGDCCAPRDSFMVYIGAGVEGNQWLASDGDLYGVFDPQRRWFAEVLHWDRDPASDPLSPQPLFYKELLSVSGESPPTAVSFTIAHAALAPFRVKNGRVRLVFRVKTNRGFDDQGNSYSSNCLGAVVVDDVRIRIGANPEVVLGTFEDLSEIDNRLEVSALDAWKSTGKPPAIFHHVHDFASLLYEDICGQKGDITRICDMGGVVISGGDHDQFEELGGPAGTARREVLDGMISPAISLVDDDGNPETKNVHGLYGPGGNGGVGDVVATEDIYVDYDLYAGAMDPFWKGVLWQFGFQSYPAMGDATHGSYLLWGNVRTPNFILFNPDQECFRNLHPAFASGLIKTSNPSGIPDSIRIFLRKWVTCFRFGVTMGCRSRDGVYWDNVSLTLVDGEPNRVTVDLWDWWNDTFPANETSGYPGVASLFDTTAAYIKTSRNLAPLTNTASRLQVPGDTIVVRASPTVARVDLVFRLLPGPGNYQPIGDGVNGAIRRVPSDTAQVTPHDGSWWDVYRRIPGEYASPNAAARMASASGGWDPNVWLSARCDTAEINFYPRPLDVVVKGPSALDWMSTYHEADPRYALLGIEKNVCFVRCSTCSITDVVCDGTVPVIGTPGGYLPPGTPGTTIEGTKIIPDGLLTPGAHVQYFFRAQTEETPGPAAALLPDTNVVSPQVAEGSIDGHRWQQFGVLPDRWKDRQYLHPVYRTFGRGLGCMLVVDKADRRGNERVWVSVADTIGATRQEKWGAHNGWHARGDGDVNDPAANLRSDGGVGFTVIHGGQPGTTWDLYQVKGSESLDQAGSIGGRLVNRSDPLLGPKSSRQGPTPEMLDAYYSIILYLTGDLDAGTLGPFRNHGANDAGILSGWLKHGNQRFVDRAIWAIGDGFVEDNDFFLNEQPRLDLMSNYFRVSLVHSDYQTLAGNSDPDAELVVFPEWRGKDPDQIETYGLRNRCLWTTDVLDVSTPVLARTTSEYRRKGGGLNGPHYAGVYKDWDPSSPWRALVSGWDLENLTSRNDVNTRGRRDHLTSMFHTPLYTLGCFIPAPPIIYPGVQDPDPAHFLHLRNNPLASGSAVIHFGTTRADRVEIRVYDVSGRLVRTVADRRFPPGEHEIFWDGLDDERRPVPRGVYFTRVRYHEQGFLGARKVTVLK